MKILCIIIAHDGRKNTLPDVIKTTNNIKKIDKIEIFCFDTEVETIKIAKEYNLTCNIRNRPVIDMSKISCSYINLATGMWEGELMHLSFLRNEVLDYISNTDYDYLFWLDADVICPPDTVERLLKLNSDVAFGWYFHKRIPLPAVKFEGQKWETMDSFYKNKSIVKGFSGGNGGVLIHRKVFIDTRYNLYNGLKAEDVVYFNKVHNSNYSMKLDLGLYYEHIGMDWKPLAIQFAKKKAELWGIDFKI